MVRDFLGIKPQRSPSAASGSAMPDSEAVHEAAGLMAERPLDDIGRATVAALKAKGLI